LFAEPGLGSRGHDVGSEVSFLSNLNFLSVKSCVFDHDHGIGSWRCGRSRHDRDGLARDNLKVRACSSSYFSNHSKPGWEIGYVGGTDGIPIAGSSRKWRKGTIRDDEFR
jgi:hypothetical protein